MAFPPNPIAADKAPGTPDNLNEHPDHHNALATAINDITDHVQTIRVQQMLLVESVADLEPYTDGVGGWTLPTGLVMFSGFVDLGAGYVTPSAGTVVRGLADAVVMSTTTGGVLRCTDHAANLVVRELSLVAPAGPCVMLHGLIGFQVNLFFVGLIGASAGTITGWNVQSVKQCYIEAADGLTFDGTTRKVFVSETPFYAVTGAAIRFASTLVADVVDIVTSFFKFDSPGVGVKAEAGYSILSGNLRGSMSVGTAIPLVGLTPGEVQWTMTNNTDIANSRVVGVLSLTAAAVTDIVTTNVAVKVAGTTTPWPVNQRFSHSNGRLTYIGLEPVVVDMSASYSVDSSNNQLLSFYVALNGVVIAASRSVVRVGNGADERPGSVVGIVEMKTGDHLEVWAANNTSNADLTVLSMTMKAGV